MLLLEDLRPADTLWLVAEAARNGLHEILTDARISLQTGAFGTSVVLAVSDVVSEPVATWLDDYQLRTDQVPKRGMVGDHGTSLLNGLVTLLLEHCPGTDFDEERREWLALVPGVPREPVAELFEALRFHATSTRVAPMALGERRHYLFHILDDVERKSSFQSLLAADTLDRAALLRGWVTDHGMVFIPHGVVPNEDALADFARAVALAPAVFGLRASDMAAEQDNVAVETMRRRALLALFPGGENKQVRLLGLARLTFYDDVSLAPSAARYAQVDVHDLASSKTALHDLHQAIRKTKPQIGYRLELRQTRQQAPLEAERLRVRQQLTELEHQLAYLESMAQPRPYLLRFSYKQLPAMADYLRGVGMQTLASGALRYGFHATETTPTGWHYLWVDPVRVQRDDIDTLMQWADLDRPPMRFWLDPFWARYYHDDAGDCLVFVPDRLALFPPMHAWQAEDMDRYLRRVIEQWFRETAMQATIPARPLYVFEGEPHARARLLITILDQDAFQPLHTRLDWINDNLSLARRFDGESLLKQLANHQKREALLDELGRRANHVEARFEEVALRTARSVAEELDTLTRVVTAESDALIKDLYRTVERLRRLRDGLQSLDRFRKDMGKVSSETRKTVSETFRRESALQKDIRQLEHQIMHAIRLRTGIEDRVENEVKSLQETHDRLQDRFMRLIRRE